MGSVIIHLNIFQYAVFSTDFQDKKVATRELVKSVFDRQTIAQEKFEGMEVQPQSPESFDKLIRSQCATCFLGLLERQ